MFRRRLPGRSDRHVAPGPRHGQIRATWEPATTGGAAARWYLEAKAGDVLIDDILVVDSARTHTFSNLDTTLSYTILLRGVGAGNKNGDSTETSGVLPLDTVKPSFSGAEVIGTTLTVTFDDGLDTSSTPAGSAFSVSATPAAHNPNIAGTGTATVAVMTATVTLAEAVIPLETVKVSYSAPDTGPLQDNSGNEVTSFSDQDVTNNTGVVELFDTATGCENVNFCTHAPTGAAQPGPNHGQITLHWKTADSGKDPTRGWNVTRSESGADTFSGSDISDGNVGVHTFSGLDPSKTYDVRVRGATNDSNNNKVSGNFARANGVRPFNDVTGPAFSSARVAGATLVVTFNETLKANSALSPDQFTVMEGASRVNVASGGVAISGKDVTLTLSAAVAPAVAVTVAYAKPASNPLEDTQGNDAATFSRPAGVQQHPAAGWSALRPLRHRVQRPHLSGRPGGLRRARTGARPDHPPLEPRYHRRRRDGGLETPLQENFGKLGQHLGRVSPAPR